jgi:transcriptional regulator with XRE-family HTH domain
MTSTPSNEWAHWGRLVARPTRERLGLTRRQLARKSGVSADSILRLERGRTRRPRLITLRALCNALDLPLPGEEGIYLSLDEIPADKLRRVVAEALYEFARRRRDAARFASLIHLPGNASALRIATATVEADRDLACEVLGLLCPDRDLTALAPSPKRPPRKRRTTLPPPPPRRTPPRHSRPHA